MDNERCLFDGFSLTKEAKREYLVSLIGKIYKVLHLFEERKTTGFSPEFFIYGQIWEINAANGWFDNKLTPVLVKLKGIYDEVNSISCKSVKKQVFEMERIVKSIIDGMN